MVLRKKIGVIMASLVLMMTMSVPVFAAPSANPLVSGTSFTFDKNVKAVNDSITGVAGPGVTFNYAIASATPDSSNGGTSITDGQGNSASVKAGPAGGLVFASDAGATASIAFSKGETLTAAADPGADNKKELTLDTVASVFSNVAPGIYRYSVSESVEPEPLPAGFTNTGGQVRYVDVYVERTEQGVGVSGIVMHNGSTASTDKKTFDDATYVTKNVAVKKVVAGNMADPQATFAFTATVSNNDRPFYTGSSEAGATTDASGPSVAATLGNNQEFWICGLSMDATVGFSETNTYGGNTYEAEYVVGSGTPQDGTAMDAANLDDNTVVTFTNTLDSVSPTGIVMKFGPYLLMVLAAAAFVFIRMRTRKADSLN